MLPSIWFLILFVLLIGYAILDGFDLGVGILHALAKNDHERRVGLNAIGPVWDGNEVWLLTAGGALFAAFPVVYATVFSAFYLAMMLVLVALIMRAVSLEFRSKVDSPAWKRVWDSLFFLGSALAPVLFGVAFGNILRGIPINQHGEFTGSFLGLLNPYALLIGLLTFVTFTLHGGLYLALKSDGDMRLRIQALLPKLWLAYIVLYVIATLATVFTSPFLFTRILATPWIWLLLPTVVASALIIPFALRRNQLRNAFLASSVAIGSMVALAGSSLYPRLVPSLTDLAHSLDITNSSSTPRTLSAMLLIALLGMPLVLAYSFFVYRIFKGKVILTSESY